MSHNVETGITISAVLPGSGGTVSSSPDYPGQCFNLNES